jgi:hypothetical protein
MDASLLIAIAALVVSVLGPAVTGYIGLQDAREARRAAAEKEEREQKDQMAKAATEAERERYDKRLTYLRQTLVRLIDARSDTGAYSLADQFPNVDQRVAEALARAKGLIYSIGDQPSHSWASSMNSTSIEYSIEQVDLAIAHLGYLISETMKTGKLPQ